MIAIDEQNATEKIQINFGSEIKAPLDEMQNNLLFA